MTRSLYRSLLWLHPPAFRAQFAEEMLWIYDETAAAGVIPLFTDGFVSLTRQWLFNSGTLTLAAAGFGGALHMALFLVMAIPMVQQSSDRVYVRRALFANGPVDTTSVRFSGKWVGTLRSTGPSGPIELMLKKAGPVWAGRLYIQGPDGAMHGGPLQAIKVEDDSLRFSVQAGDADMTFSGKLVQGKLTGILEATANGRRAVTGPKGKRVGQGTWVMARASSQNAAKMKRAHV